MSLHTDLGSWGGWVSLFDSAYLIYLVSYPLKDKHKKLDHCTKFVDMHVKERK